VTRYSDLTLFPLMALIRYQVLPLVDLPAHVVRQLRLVKVATTETFVPVRMTTRGRAAVEVIVRRFALQIAAFVTVAPSTSPGKETATTPNKSIADTNDATTDVGRDGRRERRARMDNLGTSRVRIPSFVDAAFRGYDPVGSA
jgi:hypothetical protein